MQDRETSPNVGQFAKLYRLRYIPQMWKVETLNPNVDEEIEGLPVDMQVKLLRLFEIIERQGIFDLPPKTRSPLGDKLWELRIKGKDGIARAIYITETGQRFIILRVFIKKTQKTPTKELELAKQRAKEVEK